MPEQIPVALLTDCGVRIRFHRPWSQMTLLIKDCEERGQRDRELRGSESWGWAGEVLRGCAGPHRAGSEQKLPTRLPGAQKDGVPRAPLAWDMGCCLGWNMQVAGTLVQ